MNQKKAQITLYNFPRANQPRNQRLQHSFKALSLKMSVPFVCLYIETLSSYYELHESLAIVFTILNCNQESFSFSPFLPPLKTYFRFAEDEESLFCITSEVELL